MPFRSRLLDGTMRSARTSVVRSQIKSIQPGTVVINENSLTGTATVTAVDTANAVLFFDGLVGNSTVGGWSAYNPAQLLATLELTNSTTITATKGGTYGTGIAGLTLRYTLMEFYPGLIKSIQKGSTTIATGATSGTTTVTAVTTAKAVLVGLGWTTTGINTIDPRSLYSDVVLTNSTTVTASRTLSDATYTTTINWMLVEYY